MADYLKLPEVARRLDVSEKTARRMVKSGGLPAVFIGGAYRISEEALEEYLESAKVTPGKVQAPPPQEKLFDNGESAGARREEHDFLKARNALDGFCGYWDKRLASGDVTPRELEDIGAVYNFWMPILLETLAAERNELLAAGKAGDVGSSVIWPAVERFLALGDRLEKLERDLHGADTEAEKRRSNFDVLKGMRSTG